MLKGIQSHINLSEVRYLFKNSPMYIQLALSARVQSLQSSLKGTPLGTGVPNQIPKVGCFLNPYLNFSLVSYIKMVKELIRCVRTHKSSVALEKDSWIKEKSRPCFQTWQVTYELRDQDKSIHLFITLFHHSERVSYKFS